MYSIHEDLNERTSPFYKWLSEQPKKIKKITDDIVQQWLDEQEKQENTENTQENLFQKWENYRFHNVLMKYTKIQLSTISQKIMSFKPAVSTTKPILVQDLDLFFRHDASHFVILKNREALLKSFDERKIPKSLETKLKKYFFFHGLEHETLSSYLLMRYMIDFILHGGSNEFETFLKDKHVHVEQLLPLQFTSKNLVINSYDSVEESDGDYEEQSDDEEQDDDESDGDHETTK